MSHAKKVGTLRTFCLRSRCIRQSISEFTSDLRWSVSESHQNEAVTPSTARTSALEEYWPRLKKSFLAFQLLACCLVAFFWRLQARRLKELEKRLDAKETERLSPEVASFVGSFEDSSRFLAQACQASVSNREITLGPGCLGSGRLRNQ